MSVGSEKGKKEVKESEGEREEEGKTPYVFRNTTPSSTGRKEGGRGRREGRKERRSHMNP